MSDRDTTADLLARLRRHYIKPGGALPGGIFVPECGRNGSAGSRADALYVGFTSTSGRLLVGHELKVSRADWRHELDKPGKADAWADQCHAWYVVAPSTTVVPPEELPAGWGLMVINPRTTTRLQTVVKAEVHRDRTPSWATVRSIMARQDTLRALTIDEIRRTARDTAETEVRKRIEAQRQHADRTLTPNELQRLDLLDRIENSLGYKIDTWRDDDDHLAPHRFAAAVALCRAADNGRLLPAHQRDRLDQTLVDLRERLAALGQHLDEWDTVAGQRDPR